MWKVLHDFQEHMVQSKKLGSLVRENNDQACPFRPFISIRFSVPLAIKCSLASIVHARRLPSRDANVWFG